MLYVVFIEWGRCFSGKILVGMKSELYCISSQNAFDIDDTKEKFVRFMTHVQLTLSFHTLTLLRSLRLGHTRTLRSRTIWGLCPLKRARPWTPTSCRTVSSCSRNGSCRANPRLKSRFVSCCRCHIDGNFIHCQQAPVVEESKSFKRDNANVSPANTETYMYNQFLSRYEY